MLTALVRFCVREPLIVLLLTAGLIGFGVYSVNTVPIDAIPDVGENQVIVLTDWPGGRRRTWRTRSPTRSP